MATTTTYKLFGETAMRELITLMKVFNFKTEYYVDELPEEGQEKVLYFLFVTGGEEGNLCNEYLWIKREDDSYGYELVGSATLQIDLANYAKKSDFDTLKTYLDDLKNKVEQLTSGGLTDVEFDTTAAPELTLTPSKDGTVEKVTVELDLSDYAAKDDIPELEEITASEVDSVWDEIMSD